MPRAKLFSELRLRRRNPPRAVPWRPPRLLRGERPRLGPRRGNREAIGGDDARRLPANGVGAAGDDAGVPIPLASGVSESHQTTLRSNRKLTWSSTRIRCSCQSRAEASMLLAMRLSLPSCRWKLPDDA